VAHRTGGMVRPMNCSQEGMIHTKILRRVGYRGCSRLGSQIVGEGIEVWERDLSTQTR